MAAPLPGRRLVVVDNNTDNQPDQEPDEPTTSAEFPIDQAAAALGLTVNALRLRIKRGTVPARKVDGRWWVVVGTDEATTSPPPEPATTRQPGDQAGTTSRQPVDKGALVAALEDHIDFLRGELQLRGEEIRRRDHIIAGLVERVQALPATVDASDVSQERDPGSPRSDDAVEASQVLQTSPASQESPLRRWWRLLGGR